MKQYIGIIRDHSGSMSGLKNRAMKDYNEQIEEIKQNSRKFGIDTIVSVTEVGIFPNGSRYGIPYQQFNRVITNSSVEKLQPITDYPTPGGTPLFQALDDLINILSSVPDATSPDVAFLILVITDGEENASVITGDQLGKKIKQLQATDHWTFTFRVPGGYGQRLAGMLNIPMGNILEWEQTERGFERATRAATSGTQAYYTARSMGKTFSSSFYADVAQIPLTQVKRVANDITREVEIFQVVKGGEEIKPFVERQLQNPMRVGGAFYQLTKTEAKVQPYKQIILRDKSSGKLYGGQGTRDLLGLPQFGEVKLSPGDQGRYDVFVQSTSVNRKLVAGTEVVYWPGVRY